MKNKNGEGGRGGALGLSEVATKKCKRPFFLSEFMTNMWAQQPRKCKGEETQLCNTVSKHQTRRKTPNNSSSFSSLRRSI